MIQAELATTLDKSHLTMRFLEASILNSRAYYSVAPWTYTALMKLHNLEHHRGAQWVTHNQPVSANAAMFARVTLTNLRGDDLPIPGVCSVEGGDVALIWTVGMKQLEAIFGADRSGSFVLSDGDRIIEDGEFAQDNTGSLSEALKSIVAE